MTEDLQELINTWARTYINMGYHTKTELYAALGEITEDGDLFENLMAEENLNEEAAEKAIQTAIHNTVDQLWEQRIQEQQTWNITLHEKLHAAFEDLRLNHNFVHAMNAGEDIQGLRRLLIHTAEGTNFREIAYIGFHEQALENAVDEGGAPYLIYGPTRQPTKRFLETKPAYTKRQNKLYRSIAETISTVLTQHNIKNILQGEMLYIDEQWRKKLNEHSA